MLDAKCIRMRDFATKISKNFLGHCPQTPMLGGAMVPLPDPTPSVLRRFTPHARPSRNEEIKSWQP